MTKILVVGSINLDQVLKMKNFPKHGETIYSLGKEIFLGGKGANQAIALKKLQVEVDFIGKIGNDQEGSFVLKEIQKHKINSENIIKTSMHTGIASIYVSANGENTIVLVPGANDSFQHEDIVEWKKKLIKYDYLLLQLEITNAFVFELIKLAKSLNKIVILNPAPAKKIPPEILHLCDYIIPNETELATIFDKDPISNENEIFETLFKSQKQYPDTKIIVTFGAKGVYYLNTNSKLINIPAKKNIEVVDTTGAGDSFIGGFVSQLSQEKSLEEAIHFGNKVASITITRKGAAASLPTYEEVIKNV